MVVSSIFRGANLSHRKRTCSYTASPSDGQIGVTLRTPLNRPLEPADDVALLGVLVTLVKAASVGTEA
jgi:hypothetical protein